jgi:acetoin utilization protein AcuB
MKKLPSVASVMTPFPHAVESDQPLTEAKAMMERHDFHQLPVTEGGELVGVLSERDLAFGESLARERGRAAPLTVAAVYTPHPYVVDIATALEEVVGSMAARHLGSALITRNGKLVGILTHSDLARLLEQMLLAQRPPPDEIA